MRSRLEAVLLEQMGEPRVQCAGSPRLPNASLHQFLGCHYTTEAEIRWVAERMRGLVAELRAGGALARR